MDSIYFYCLFLFPLAVIGAVCCYTDIKYGKIFNKWIVFGFINIFFLYIFLFFYKANIDYIFEAILNGAIAFLAGYLLWHFKLWAAGDAKLFALYAFLIPLHFYSKSYLPYFPSFNLLVNLFMPLLFVLMLGALITALKEGWRLKNKTKGLEIANKQKTFRFLISLCQMFLTYLFAIMVLRFFLFFMEKSLENQSSLNPFIVFILLFLTMGYLNKKKQEKKWLNFVIYGTVLACAGFFALSGEIQLLITVLKTALVFMVLVGLTRRVLNFYIQKKQIRRIKIKDLREGMVLVKDKTSLFFKKLKEKEEELGILDAGGLKKNQAELIKNLFQEDKEAETGIYRTFPFAPFLFLSAIISILTQSSFLPLLNQALQYLLR